MTARRQALRATVEAQLVSSPNFELSLSVAQFIGGLPQELAHVAKLLLHEEGEFAEAQRRSGLASSDFYRRLREIRVQLVCAGIVRKRLSPDDKGGPEGN